MGRGKLCYTLKGTQIVHINGNCCSLGIDHLSEEVHCKQNFDGKKMKLLLLDYTDTRQSPKSISQPILLFPWSGFLGTEMFTQMRLKR